MKQKKIHCTNCGFEGKAKIKGNGGWFFLLGIILGIVGLFVWPILIVAVACFGLAVFGPAKQICPKCDWQNTVPLEQWQTRSVNG